MKEIMKRMSVWAAVLLAAAPAARAEDGIEDSIVNSGPASAGFSDMAASGQDEPLTITTENDDQVLVERVNIAPLENQIMNVGSTVTFQGFFEPVGASDTLEWDSTDTSVATIDTNGTLTALKGGKTVVSATTQNVGASGNRVISNQVTVSVVAKTIYASSVTLGDSADLMVGRTQSVSATVSPDNTTVRGTWTSANPGIVKVVSDTRGAKAALNQTALLEGVSVGQTLVTFQIQSGPHDTDMIEKSIPVNVIRDPDEKDQTGGGSSGGSSGSSSGGSSGGSAGTPLLNKRAGIDAVKLQSTDVPLGKLAAQSEAGGRDYVVLSSAMGKLAAQAEAAGRDYAVLSSAQPVEIQGNAWGALKDFPLAVQMTEAGAVRLQLLLPDPAKLTGPLTLDSAGAEDVAARFGKWFQNPLTAVSVGYEGSLGQQAEAAVRTGWDANGSAPLRVYRYDEKANAYREVEDAEPWIDKNGYARFSVPEGGVYVISKGPLERR